MSGIMTDLSLAIVIDGNIKEIPFLNTKDYFDNDLCFAIKKGNRILYLPAKADPKVTGFSRSLCFYYESQKYYFITRKLINGKNLQVLITLNETEVGRVTDTGELKVTVGGQLLGLTFNLYFTHKSGNYCCEDFELTITAGSAGITKSVIFSTYPVTYSEVKTVTCDISDTSIDIDLYGIGEKGTVWTDDFNFDLSE